MSILIHVTPVWRWMALLHRLRFRYFFPVVTNCNIRCVERRTANWKKRLIGKAVYGKISETDREYVLFGTGFAQFIKAEWRIYMSWNKTNISPVNGLAPSHYLNQCIIFVSLLLVHLSIHSFGIVSDPVIDVFYFTAGVGSDCFHSGSLSICLSVCQSDGLSVPLWRESCPHCILNITSRVHILFGHVPNWLW